MSFDASAWAIKAAVSRSATKNLLMIVAHLTNDETGELYPSLGYLEAHTGLSRKTVIACLQELESLGVLVRTGEMKGRTQQIPVYRFVKAKTVRMIRKGTGGKFHLCDSDDETVAFLPGKGGVFTEETVVKTPPGIEKGNREEEHTPPFLTEGAPPRDLLGDPIPGAGTEIVEARGSLLDYVLERWNALTEEFPRIPKVRAWSDARKKLVARRADEVVRSTAGAIDAYQVWDLIFSGIRSDVWLRGDGEPGKRYDKPYAVKIDDVLRTSGNPNFLQILEKASINEQDNRATSDPRTGRRFGPTEQAIHDALARRRAARQQG